MDRDAFLARVRSCLADAEPPAGTEPYRPPAPPDHGETVERLIREHEAAGGKAHRAGSAAEARERVVEVLRGAGAKSVVRGDTPRVRELGLDRELERAGIAVTVCRLVDGASRERLREAAFAADAGVTSVDFGVAESGTLALLAGPGQGRAISLLPPIHVGVLHADDVVFELAALFEEVAARGGLPSALTFVTGPSKTGDIEQTLTVGVHGPGELHLVVIDQPSRRRVPARRSNR